MGAPSDSDHVPLERAAEGHGSGRGRRQRGKRAMTSHIQRLRQNCMTFRSCVYKMADNECMGEISGGIEIKEFSCKNSFDMMRVESHRNGISEGCKCGEESCLCVVATCEKFNQRLMMNGMNNYQGSNDDACCNVSSLGLQDLEREDGSVSPMDCNSYSNKRRTLRFDSSESSDR